eukprot:m.649649 g.649649  ORF g.649649 m.649649 type:complete len:254 (-) comp58391_c0_seq3:64-825(-)
MRSVRSEAFDLFGLRWPVGLPDFADGATSAWAIACSSTYCEIETGQMLINKPLAWKALNVAAFISFNHEYFLKKLFRGDKQTFELAFQYAQAPYEVVPFEPQSLGMRAQYKGSKGFCGNSIAQRHPDTGKIVFLHRTAIKFREPWDFFAAPHADGLHAWRYLAAQVPLGSWTVMYKDKVSNKFFVGGNTTQNECVTPRDSASLTVKKVPARITEIEGIALGYLKEVLALPYFPSSIAACTALNPQMTFFCTHS